MADIVINGATYKDVPSIEVPSSDGGMANFQSQELLDSIIGRTLVGSYKITSEIIGSYAFANSLIEEVSIPNLINLEGYYPIGNFAFFNCLSLTKASSNCTKVGYGTFRGCNSLNYCDFPNFKYCDYFSFYGCSKLETFDCNNLISMGAYSFQNSGIKALIIRSESLPALASANSFESTPIASGTGFIYVPSDLVESYKTATNWAVYASQFRALEDYTVDGTITGELDESKI